MEKKQTAVEWLKKELEEYGSPYSLNVDWETLDQLIEQSKQMEKEQIIDAYCIGKYINVDDREFGEKFYNETYGKEADRS